MTRVGRSVRETKGKHNRTQLDNWGQLDRSTFKQWPRGAGRVRPDHRGQGSISATVCGYLGGKLMAGNSSWYAYRKVFRRRIFWQQVGDSSRKFRWRLLDCNDVNFKLLLAGWLLFLGDSWTLAADPSLQLGVSQDIGDGGAMVVCHYPRDGTNPIDVLIHFHGAVAVAADNFTRSKRDGALIVIHFNGLSAAYARPFQTSPALFDRVLDLTASQLGRETTWGQIPCLGLCGRHWARSSRTSAQHSPVVGSLVGSALR